MNEQSSDLPDMRITTVPGNCCPPQGQVQVIPQRLEQPFVAGFVDTPAGRVPKISSELSCTDHWGAFKVRWGISRMDYKVEPGLYALGDPDVKSSVLVTANYKLSFDNLRGSLPGRNCWVLVLDTKGINVWCAAGKGTFGTQELVGRIESSGLPHVVSHQKLILPQLAAPGVTAHQVKKLSGFEVLYGPVRTRDLPAFLDNGLKATAQMRLKTFTTRERAALIPVELVGTLIPGLLIMTIFFLVGGLGGPGGFWVNALRHGLFTVLCLVAALLAGAVLTPLLLPWLPGRAYSLKGMTMGLIVVGALLVFRSGEITNLKELLEISGWFLMVPAVASYLAMNFTGSSTYTSLSGVKKEMKWAVPVELSGAGVGLCLWLGSHFLI